MRVSVSVSSEVFRRLEWQCRRGLNEVEVILIPFFEKHFEQLSIEEQQTFEVLLASQDMDLFDWFTRRAVSDEDSVQLLVEKILSCVESKL